MNQHALEQFDTAIDGPAEPSGDFDYARLDADVADIIRERTESIRVHGRRGIEAMLAIGDDLLAVKDILEHGQFSDWLAAEFDWSARTAERLMQVARAFRSAKLADLAALTQSALYALAEGTATEAARIEAIERAKTGERLRLKDVRQIIARHPPKPVEVVGVESASTDSPVEAVTVEPVEVEPMIAQAEPTNGGPGRSPVDPPKRPAWASDVEGLLDHAVERLTAVAPAEAAAYLDSTYEERCEYSREEWREQYLQKISTLGEWLNRHGRALVEPAMERVAVVQVAERTH